MTERKFTDVNEAQADGLACVICGNDYRQLVVAHRPVGRSHTGSQVFACSGECTDIAMAEVTGEKGADEGCRVSPPVKR